MNKTTLEIERALVGRIESLAREAFKDHIITMESSNGVHRTYDCRRPRSFAYQFRVVTFPGHLVVAGDIGDVMWARVPDMFTWAPNAAESIDYFAEKVVAGQTREYCGDTARQFLVELEQELDQDDPDYSKHRKALKEFQEWSDPSDVYRFQADLYDSGLVDGCDFPDLTNFTPTYLWCREAVRWFFRNLGGTPRHPHHPRLQ